ncbi:hypothetical protein ABIA33_000035 [Streptacidiphilus sp. MAP12-16]|uniref:hypothetical protein n=1 Tax=Streptacidiphilus sp. MAP12-16 TaxID=3156300 RepID=UPI003516FFFC
MTRPVPNRPRPRLAALVALLAVLLLGLGAAPAAGAAGLAPTLPRAQQQQTFGIQPASASGPDTRTGYTFAASPGAQLKDHVAVWNYGDQPLTLTLCAADAFNTDSGGYDVLPAGKPSSDIGSWVHLAAASVQLPPRTRQIVPFTLAVPTAATPGDHSGGIVLSLRRHTVDAKGNAVAVDQRVGTRIHLRVPGALRPRLAVESVHVVYHGTLNPFGTGSTTTSYLVRNTGNVRLAGHQAVRVRNALGNLVTARGPADLTELLPGNTETYTVQVSGVFPTLWSTASVTIDPQALPGDVDPALPSATSSVSYATVPWTLLAIVLPLIALAVRQFLRRRRRRTGGGGTPSAPLVPPVPPAPTAPAGPTVPAAEAPEVAEGKTAVPEGKTAAPVTAMLGLVLLLALGSVAVAAPRALADGGTGSGTLAFDYATGHDDDPIDVVTSGRCPHPGDWLMASVSGAGFPAAGASVLGLSSAGIYSVAANGGYVVPLTETLRVVAQQHGVSALRGRYVVDVYCRGRFLPAHLRDFDGALTFGAKGTWTAEHVAPAGLAHGSESTATPSVAAGTANAPTATPAPLAQAATAAGAGTPVGSVIAMAGGGALLAFLGAAQVRRRRAQVKAARR